MKTGLLLIGILALLTVMQTNAATITLSPNITLQNKYGKLVTVNAQTMNSLTLYTNGTMYFDVTGLEIGQHIYSYILTAYGNGTLDLRYHGILPTQVTALSSSFTNYNTNLGSEQVQYTTSITESFIVIYQGQLSETPTVMFKDDFLTQQGYPSDAWTVDLYRDRANLTGISIQSGYMIFNLPTNLGNVTNSIAAAHVLNPSYTVDNLNSTPNIYIKRKLTVSLLPYKQKVTGGATSQLSIGFAPLRTSGAYPGSTPAGTPNLQSTTGLEYFSITNLGTVASNIGTLFETLDPTLYTVLTVEYAGVPSVPSTQWIYYRIYQNDQNGKILQGTDVNLNVTGGLISPFAQTNYVFIHQLNLSYNIISRIDLVQLQNYGSPVDLRIPPIIPFPTCSNIGPTSTCGPGIIPLLTLIAVSWGLGNAQFGAILLFMVWMGAIITPLAVFTRHTFVVAVGGLLNITLFAYAGLLPTWLIVLEIFGTAILTVILFRKVIGTGGESSGDSSEAGTSGGIE